MTRDHPLEKMFALPAASIFDVVQRNNRLLMAVKGGIAQEHLRQYLVGLRDSREITDFGLLIEEGKSPTEQRRRPQPSTQRRRVGGEFAIVLQNLQELA